VTIMVTNLPTGSYDVLPYSSDGSFELSVGGLSYGVLHSLDTPVTNPPVWTEGRQYVNYTNVLVDVGQTLFLTVRPGVFGYATISGLQIWPAGSRPLSIVRQPASQTVATGSSVSLEVAAVGTSPLRYQWLYDGWALAGATGNVLTLTNVQVGQAGNYVVVVSDPTGSLLSSTAVLTVNMSLPRSMGLLDIDFGQDAGPSPERGFAAIGQSTNDFWNFYTRDDPFGHWLTFGVLPNLSQVDGTPTQAGLTVANAPGDWGNGSSDGMYNTYIYPFDGSNVTITVTNLPAGNYDVLPYSYDGNFELSVGGMSYGVQHSFDTPVTNPPVWTAGQQYVRYSSVPVGAGQTLSLIVRPGVFGYATISGLQIGYGTSGPPFIAQQPLVKLSRREAR